MRIRRRRHCLPAWGTLTIAEQTLMRRAVLGYGLAGMVQNYGAALRWADTADAPPPRSYTRDEQVTLVPSLAAVALDLAERGLLRVHEVRDSRDWLSEVSGPALTRTDLHDALTEPSGWTGGTEGARSFRLSAPQSVREQWWEGACPTADASGLPTWNELSVPEREVLVCAYETGSMLTGAWGIWGDLPAGLDGEQLLAWVDEQLAPLVPFVRKGWIEVLHRPEEDSDSDTVIPLDRLREAFSDPVMRYDGDGGDWGVGLSCHFTYEGLAVWRGGWSSEWHRRLHFD